MGDTQPREAAPAEDAASTRAFRVLYASSLVNAIGTGMYLAGSAIFFTRYLGLPDLDVGTGLTAGSIVGLFTGIPAGHLADRFGARRLYVISLCLEAAAMLLFVFADSIWSFIAVTTAASVAASASSAARGPVIQSVSRADPAGLKARIRSVSNAGYFAGGAIAGGVLSTSDKTFYLLLILGNALSFAVCAAMVLSLPRIAPTARKEPGGSWRSLRDRPYLGICAVNVGMSLQYAVLPLVLPLWVVGHTSIPRWMIATLIPTNTLLVVLLQPKLSPYVKTLRSAAVVLSRGGVLMFVSFVLMACVPRVGTGFGIAILVLSVAVNAFGEIAWVGGSYELSFGMARQDAMGQYIGLYSVSGGVGRAASQAVATVLCLDLGFGGWLGYGALILVPSLAAPAVVGWAQRARESAEAGRRLDAGGTGDVGEAPGAAGTADAAG